VVTNVPGPQVPLYMLSAKMVDNFGFIPLLDSLCLGVVLFSYAGQLCWGFTAEWDLLPDLDDFVADIKASFRELRNVPGRAEIRPVRRTSASAKRRPFSASASLGKRSHSVAKRNKKKKQLGRGRRMRER
jgi:hypothetical protein